MNTHKMLTPKGDTVVVYSTVTRYTWFTGWVRNHGIATADLMVNVRNIVGACQVKPCYQTAAALIDYPDAPTVITAGSYLTAAGFGHLCVRRASHGRTPNPAGVGSGAPPPTPPPEDSPSPGSPLQSRDSVADATSSLNSARRWG